MNKASPRTLKKPSIYKSNDTINYLITNEDINVFIIEIERVTDDKKIYVDLDKENTSQSIIGNKKGKNNNIAV